MAWIMKVGQFDSQHVVKFDGEKVIDPDQRSLGLLEHYWYPEMTPEDLWCLTFYEFSRSIRFASLIDCPMPPMEVYRRGEQVRERWIESGSENGLGRISEEDITRFYGPAEE